MPLATMFGIMVQVFGIAATMCLLIAAFVTSRRERALPSFDPKKRHYAWLTLALLLGALFVFGICVAGSR